jgi:hypothetical protein
MKIFYRLTSILTILLFTTTILKAQTQPAFPFTADDYVRPYNANFEYGSNMGYYGNGWEDKTLAALLNKSGGRTLRTSLPESFVERYGYAFNLGNFRTYANELNMRELTCFVGGPSDKHRDTVTYAGSDKQSKLFLNLYEPIWNADSTVNENNYYAIYIYRLIQNYGEYVRFWEVVNEPDYAYSYSIAQKWMARAPLPGELPNMLAPVYNYIRMLRITWEVVKKYSPDDYVTTGGIGYTQFLDALLRYTDNPNEGQVTAQYPRRGGSYFDVLSYHIYPAFNMAKWDNSIGGFRYTRTSDYMAKNMVDYKDEMNNILKTYGYNGNTYPQKNFLLTEINVSRRTCGDHITSDELQRNFGIKAVVLAKKSQISQLYFFDVGETTDAPPPGDSVIGYDEFRLMGLFQNLKRDKPGAEISTDLGKAFKTAAQLMNGFRYDSVRTAALQMPAGMDGAAFVRQSKYAYILWAKALVDKSETATLNYSFPPGTAAASMYRYEWDNSVTEVLNQISSNNVLMTGSPAIFSDEPLAKMLSNQTISFPAQPVKLYGDAPFQLNALASSELPITYRVVSGPGTISNDILTIAGAGTIVVSANQPGNNYFDAAYQVTQAIVVNKIAQTLTFASMASRTYSDAPITLNAVASSRIPVVFRVVSGAATVSGNALSLTGSGWISIEASQPGDSNYLAARIISQGFTVFKASQSIDFAPLPARVVGDVPFAVNATATSGLPVLFRVLYGPATISGNTVTITGSGYVGIEASQPGNAGNSAAQNVTQGFSVTRPVVASIFEGSSIEQVSDVAESIKPPVSRSTLSTYPNPFSHNATIEFVLEKSEKVSVDLFDMQGKFVHRLFSGTVDASVRKRLRLSSSGLTNSTYVIKLTTHAKVLTSIVVLSK